MIETIDHVLLSRLQFAFTVSFHIIFPAFTIGLASWLAVIEGMWLNTKKPVYKELYQFWIKIFAVTFGMGVVSGLVMSYEFGTNWSVFSDTVGNVLGPLLGYEVLTAFFLEATFLGIMLFGWNKVHPKMHFASTIIVAVGTVISAFWILAANSWMQTPTGYWIDTNGQIFPSNWWEVIFNPSFPYRFMHMVSAAYLTTAFTIGGIAAWYLWKQRHVDHAKVMFGMAMIMAIFLTPIQIFIGDAHGLNTLKHQPIKVSAMEGIWDTEKGAALRLVGWPDMEEEKTKYAIEIPKLASIILTHSINGEVRGLKSWPKDELPPVAWVFWCFRIMVGIGFLMLFTGIFAVIHYFRKKLYSTRWFQVWCMALTPAGFIAVIAGWFVTEIGRQPYVVYDLMRTVDAASPLTPPETGISLLAFVLSYFFIFGAGTYYILRLIGKGPKAAISTETYGMHGIEENQEEPKQS